MLYMFSFVVSRYLLQMYKEILFNNKITQPLFAFRNKEEVAVVYFRDGYVPIHFQSPSAWNVKLTIERSTAIKCPCIQYMLVNTKKVQMALCDPLIIQKYISDRSVIDQLLSTFARKFLLIACNLKWDIK